MIRSNFIRPSRPRNRHLGARSISRALLSAVHCLRPIPSAPFALALVLAAGATGLPAGAQILPLSGEFQANQNTSHCVIESGVFGRDDGSFGVVWTASGTSELQARRYDVSGAPIGNEMSLPSASHTVLGDVVATPDGGFVAAWLTFQSGAYEVRGQRYSWTGTAVGAELAISGATTSELTPPEIDVDEQGGLVAVWSRGSGIPTAIEGRRIASDGTPLGSIFTVTSAGNVEHPDVGRDPDSGEFVVVWADGLQSDVRARRYDSSGTPVGTEMTVHASTDGAQGRPSVAVSARGETMVAWRGSTPTSGAGYRAVLSQLDAAGTILGEVPLGDTVTEQDLPALAASPDLSSFVVAFEEVGYVPGSGSEYDLRAAFNLSTDQQVTSAEIGPQLQPTVALDPAERATIAWLTDPDEDGCYDVAGVRGQLYHLLSPGQPHQGRLHTAAAQSAWRYFPAPILGPGETTVELGGLTGDLDLYVHSGGLPTLGAFTCRPYAGGLQTETCTILGDGFWWIGLNAFEVGTSDYVLTVTHVPALFADGFESGDTSAWSAP